MTWDWSDDDKNMLRFFSEYNYLIQNGQSENQIQYDDQAPNNASSPQTLPFISYSKFYSKKVRQLFSFRCRIDNKLYPTAVKKGDTIHKLAIYLVEEMSQIYILEWIAEKDHTTEIYNDSSIKFLRICSYEELKMQKIFEDFRNEMSVFELWNKYRDQE